MRSNPSRSPIHRLPVELVASIFLYTLPEPAELEPVDPRRAQVLLRSVCCHWRAITENISAFWSTIFIRLPPMSGGNIALEMLENAKRWSANKTLSLYAVQYPLDSDDSHWPHAGNTPRQFISTLLHLLPRTMLLHLDAHALRAPEIDVELPLHGAEVLRCLTLGLLACVSLDKGDASQGTRDLGFWDVLNHANELDPRSFPFRYRASPQKLFLESDAIYQSSLSAIGDIPKLRYLHLTGRLRPVFPAGLLSSSLMSIDIEFHHPSDFAEDIGIFGSLPNLNHVAIRLSETDNDLSTGHRIIHEDLPQLPRLKTITIGMGSHGLDSQLRSYVFCNCLTSLLSRAPSLAALEVHQGHALVAVQYIHGVGKKRGSQDASVPKLELLRVIFTDHRHRRQISQSCIDLPEERPTLRIEWYEHHILKARWAEAEGNERDVDAGEDDEDDDDEYEDDEPKFWQEA